MLYRHVLLDLLTNLKENFVMIVDYHLPIALEQNEHSFQLPKEEEERLVVNSNLRLLREFKFAVGR